MSEVEKPIKNLDQEVRDMITNLIGRLSQVQRLQKHAASSTQQHHQEHNIDDDDHGLGIITLAGNNTGATMRGEMNEANPKNLGPMQSDTNNDEFATYVNSNFQAINNSIMLGGNYKTNDPGVHLDVSDYVENREALKIVKKWNNKYGSSKSEFRSDDSSSSD